MMVAFRHLMAGLPRSPAPTGLTLSTAAAVHGENLRTIAEFDIAAGEEIPFSLTWSPS